MTTDLLIEISSQRSVLLFKASQELRLILIFSQNILVVCKGPDWWVKIADFGISKRAREGDTILRTLTGTPAFTAPEILGFITSDDVLNDDNSYTSAVDIWSLGVITFFILTGKVLFRDQRLLGQYTAGRFLFPLGTLRGLLVSDKGCDFVRNLMACKPKDRPSAEESSCSPWLLAMKEPISSEPHIVRYEPPSHLKHLHCCLFLFGE
jgi:serine/threonine protein kinase